jgi:hypothetical protein
VNDPDYDEIEQLIDTDPIALGERCRRAERERDLLADALGRLLVSLGGVENVPLTGPQLLAFAEDAMAEGRLL